MYPRADGPLPIRPPGAIIKRPSTILTLEALFLPSPKKASSPVQVQTSQTSATMLVTRPLQLFLFIFSILAVALATPKPSKTSSKSAPTSTPTSVCSTGQSPRTHHHFQRIDDTLQALLNAVKLSNPQRVKELRLSSPCLVSFFRIPTLMLAWSVSLLIFSDWEPLTGTSFRRC